ncbi:hypothetical protein J3R30DRAFT_3720873 [Lentinula aciculospora]|uniref:Uncharacterized protein n=1 Tax=Lentinula aciculospora TaxID=153920 RepID=A0A9W9DEV2_9AGAR|nr:hypothetical protein J3R30DRAFT_3720873 [Lentinula aciculospora]
MGTFSRSFYNEETVAMSELEDFANSPPDSSQHDPSLIILFLVLQLIGLIGSIVTVFIARFSCVRRHLAWYNFLASWIISSLSYSLLLFAGQIDLSGDKKSGVPFGLCVFQSSVVYAAPPLTAATMLGMVAQIWFGAHSMLFNKPMVAQKLLTQIVLILPYILFIGISAEALAFGLTHPDSVRVTGSGMYCNSGLTIPGRISAGVVAVVLLPVVIIEIFIVTSLRKYWSIFKNPDTSQSRINMLSMMIRVLLFSVFGILALGLSVFFFFTIHHGAALNIVIAFIPVMAVFTFASQKDLLDVWMFWKWRKKESPIEFLHSTDIDIAKAASTLESPVSVYEEKALPSLPD